MATEPYLEGVSVVVRGAFNPVIFHPAWFAAHGLLRDKEAEAAVVNVIHPDLTFIDFGWCVLIVEPQRLQLSTAQEAYFSALRDLLVGTFGLLEYTPCQVLGVNRDFHIGLSSAQAWSALVARLAPPSEWSDILKNPDLRNLIIEGRRPDGRDGYVRVTIEPSAQQERGLYINVNDHFEDMTRPRDRAGTRWLLEILKGEWDASVRRAAEIKDNVLSKLVER